MVIACRTRLSIHIYQTGEKLVNFLVEPKKGTKWPSNLPRFSNRREAIAVCKELCRNQYLLRSEKRGKGELGVRIVCDALEFVRGVWSWWANILETLRLNGTC
jgi:translocation protein SEC62